MVVPEEVEGGLELGSRTGEGLLYHAVLLTLVHVDGTHYHFSTRDVMMVSVLLLLLLLLLLVLMPHDSSSPSPPLSPSSQAMKDANEFVETAQVHANMYGTSKRAVQVTSAALARYLLANSLPSRRALLPKVLPLHRHEVSAVESKLLSCFFLNPLTIAIRQNLHSGY